MFREILIGWLVTMAAGPGAPEEARRLWQNGRYAESQEAYEAILKAGDLAPAARAKAVLGLAECLVSQGELEPAVRAVQELADAQPDNPAPAARLAEIRLSRGDWEGAEAS